MSFLPDPTAFTAFLLAAFLVGVAPGPGMFFAVGRGLSSDVSVTIIAVLGLATASFVNCLVAATGLAALLAVNPVTFIGVKYLGAAYLVYLAFRALRDQGNGGEANDVQGKRRQAWQSYRQGFITNILNPKSAFFYLAFVPQFTDPSRGSVFAQFIILGLIFNVLGNNINLFFALMARRISLSTLRNPRTQKIRNWLTATIFAGIALHLVNSS